MNTIKCTDLKPGMELEDGNGVRIKIVKIARHMIDSQGKKIEIFNRRRNKWWVMGPGSDELKLACFDLAWDETSKHHLHRVIDPPITKGT